MFFFCTVHNRPHRYKCGGIAITVYTYNISQEVCRIKDSDILGCVTMSLGEWFLIFQKLTLPSSSKVKQSKICTSTPCPLKKDTLCSLKCLGPTQSRKQHHVPEDLNPQQLQC
jgi:hypothetical protein